MNTGIFSRAKKSILDKYASYNKPVKLKAYNPDGNSDISFDINHHKLIGNEGKLFKKFSIDCSTARKLKKQLEKHLISNTDNIITLTGINLNYASPVASVVSNFVNSPIGYEISTINFSRKLASVKKTNYAINKSVDPYQTINLKELNNGLFIERDRIFKNCKYTELSKKPVQIKYGSTNSDILYTGSLEDYDKVPSDCQFFIDCENAQKIKSELENYKKSNNITEIYNYCKKHYDYVLETILEKLKKIVYFDDNNGTIKSKDFNFDNEINIINMLLKNCYYNIILNLNITVKTIMPIIEEKEKNINDKYITTELYKCLFRAFVYKERDLKNLEPYTKYITELKKQFDNLKSELSIQKTQVNYIKNPILLQKKLDQDKYVNCTDNRIKVRVKNQFGKNYDGFISRIDIENKTFTVFKFDDKGFPVKLVVPKDRLITTLCIVKDINALVKSRKPAEQKCYNDLKINK